MGDCVGTAKSNGDHEKSRDDATLPKKEPTFERQLNPEQNAIKPANEP